MRSKLIWGLALAATLAATVLAAGCGGDDVQTREDFIEDADSICEEGTNEIGEALADQFPQGQPPAGPEFNAFAQSTAIPNIQAQIDAIRGLEPPPGEQLQVNAFLQAAQAELDKAKQDPSYLASEAAFANSNQLAADYGLTACASG
jgi:hypothetical protein